MRDSSTDSHEYLFAPRRVGAVDRKLGSFRLLHELGSGGMAALYLATDIDGRLLAIKRLHRHLAQDASFVAMFHDEAHIASLLDHPNIAKVLRLERVGEELLIVMEYVHGESLAALLGEFAHQRQRLPFEAALHLLGQACLGVHAAHEQRSADGAPLGIVHRDLSPHNLLVTYEGELKIVDFGVAKATGKLHHSETGMIKGKLTYLSPEQAAGGSVDRRSDIYTLGLLVYEALSGRRAIDGDTPAEILRHAQAADYPSIEDLRPDLPEGVIALIHRALAPDPDTRYDTAAALYRDIYHLLTAGPPSMTTQTLGEIMRRVFGRRYALREELRALAFQAPEVLEEEELTLAASDAEAATHRCEHCGHKALTAQALDEHVRTCPQRRWWEHNFGGSQTNRSAGDAEILRHPLREDPGTPSETRNGAGRSLWSRLRERIGAKRIDPIVARLNAIEARLAGIHDRRTAELARRGTATLWQLVHEVTKEDNESPGREGLLGRLKPRLTRCGDALLAMALELESTQAYRATMARLDLPGEVTRLEYRQSQEVDAALNKAITQTLHRKRALADELREVSKQQEILELRLEAMVDALGVTLGKVARITASSAFGDARADTQITVFLDSLVLHLDRLGDSLQEIDDTLKAP